MKIVNIRLRLRKVGKELKQSELKKGMIVMTRNKELYYFTGDYFKCIIDGGWLSLNEYTDDLMIIRGRHDFDIIQVYDIVYEENINSPKKYPKYPRIKSQKYRDSTEVGR